MIGDALALVLRNEGTDVLDQAKIMIVEDDFLIADEIALTVEDYGGIVIGPVAAVADALAVLDDTKVDAAILDGNLLDRDITPVAVRLISAKIPVVIYSAIGVPDELAILHPDILAISKPAKIALVVERLAELMKS